MKVKDSHFERQHLFLYNGVKPYQGQLGALTKPILLNSPARSNDTTCGYVIPNQLWSALAGRAEGYQIFAKERAQTFSYDFQIKVSQKRQCERDRGR